MRVVPYDVNDRPEWVHVCDLAVVEAWKRNNPGGEWWWFDPRPYVDAVLAAVLDKGEPERCPTCGSTHPNIHWPQHIAGHHPWCPDPWHGEQKGDEG